MSERGLDKITKIAEAMSRRAEIEKIKRNLSLNTINHQEVRKHLREEITKKLFKIRNAKDFKSIWFYAILALQAVKRGVYLMKNKLKENAWQSKVFWIQLKLKINLAMMVKKNGTNQKERNRRKIKHCISSLGEITALT